MFSGPFALFSTTGHMTQALGPCVVVGSSRGLGAALVDALLRAGAPRVLGVARTPRAAMAAQQPWAGTGRYQHLELDVTTEAAVGRLSDALTTLPPGRLRVIYNAAVLKSDLPPADGIDWTSVDEVNRVGVTGFVNTVRAAEPHLLRTDGILAGISSYAAIAPPVREPRLAYPASKAYLDMALRVLRQRWRGRVRVVTVRLGHLGLARPRGWRRLVRPSYEMAADRVLAALVAARGPDVVGYPWAYSAVYGGLASLLPDRAYFALFGRLLHDGRSR